MPTVPRGRLRGSTSCTLTTALRGGRQPHTGPALRRTGAARWVRRGGRLFFGRVRMSLPSSAIMFRALHPGRRDSYRWRLDGTTRYHAQALHQHDRAPGLREPAAGARARLDAGACLAESFSFRVQNHMTASDSASIRAACDDMSATGTFLYMSGLTVPHPG